MWYLCMIPLRYRGSGGLQDRKVDVELIKVCASIEVGGAAGAEREYNNIIILDTISNHVQVVRNKTL